MNLRRSAALSPDAVGTMTYVKVEIGYAFLPADLGGSTIFSCERFVTFFGSCESAALTPRTPGVVNPPALFWISANEKWLVIEYAASTYVIAPSVALTTPATQPLPLPPDPARSFTV